MALDLTARAMATAALQSAGSVPLFTAISGRHIDEAVILIATGGYAQPGQGSALYVSDSLATPALAAAHPLFCATTRNGRIFRALADEEGLVAVSAGGVIGTDVPDHATNHQPALQAAIAYARAVGAGGLRFDRQHYSLWTPLRTFGTRQMDLDLSGIPLVVTVSVEFRAAASGTILHRRKRDGSDPAIFAGTQQLADGSWWRGGMIALAGPKTAPASYLDRPTLTLRGAWTLDGGIPMSGQATYTGPATSDPYPLNPDGSLWDISDKGIFFPSSYHNGDLVLEGHIRIDGFRGELIYQGGTTHGSIYQSGRLELSNSDGDGFNPGPGVSAAGDGRILAEFIHVHHVRQALEGATGRLQASIGRMLIEDCTTAGGLRTGRWGDAPTIGTQNPTLVMTNVHVERSSNFVVHRGNQIGRLTCIDSYVDVGASNMDCFNASVDALTVIADRSSLGRAVGFYTAGSGGTFNNRIRHLHCDQTASAIANSRTIGKPVDWNGVLGAGNWVDQITGKASSPSASSNYAASTGFAVGFGQVAMDGFQGAGNAVQNVETTPALTYAYGHLVTLTTTAASGVFPVTLPNVAGKLPTGSRMRVHNGTAGSLMVFQTTNTRMPRRQLLRPNTTSLFEFDGSFWVPLSPYPVISGTLTASLQKAGAAIPAGDISDEVTLTLSGAKAGMHVSIAPSAAISADAMLMARVVSDNTIGIRARNANLGATLAIGSATYVVQATYLN